LRIISRSYLSVDCLTLYYGSKDINLKPELHRGRKDNDYGAGFYTTPSKELAKEWAWSGYTLGDQGYLYTYSVDKHGLKILDLTSCDSLNWIAELLVHRKFNLDNREAYVSSMERFISRYKLDTSSYDIIIGYRADDSYFEYARDFVTGAIFRGTLDSALRVGNLGIQVFIKSPLAFSKLVFVDKVLVDSKYRNYFLKRDKMARAEYNKIKHHQVTQDKSVLSDYI